MTSKNKYEYIDEVPQELICVVCTKLFINPVQTPCSHVFCYQCIKNDPDRERDCPLTTCSARFHTKELRSAPTIVVGMIDKLRVKCVYCENTNLHRGVFDDHIQKDCHKIEVQCRAADIRCSWKGSQDQLSEHLKICVFHQLSMVLRELMKNIQQQSSQIENLTQQVEEHKTQLNDVQTETAIQKIIEIKEEIQNLKHNVKLRTQLFVPSIHVSTKWLQNGITVAGSNKAGNGLNQLNGPWAVHVDNDQTIYIADHCNHRIVEWKNGATSGQVVAGKSGQGNRNDQLSFPMNVIVNKQSDCLIICDTGNRRVVRWPRRNGTSGETIISNIACWGLAMDNDGYVYVSDVEKHGVRRWKIGETNGTLVAGGNGLGNRADQFNYPQYIFVDQDHSVYVSDCHNHRVMKWMRNAKQGIVVAGGQGVGNDLIQLSYPRGVIVDQLGTVYVVENGNHRVTRWLKGATQGSVIVGGNGGIRQSNQLNYPTDLSFDQENNLYVIDGKKNRVQKFQIDSH